MKRNYDSVALFYDRLARLVYGRAQVNAQLFLLAAIREGASILVVGGGTGWILEEIAIRRPTGLTITYIDASYKMIALAQKRNVGANNVTFIAKPVQEVAFDSMYDVVLTPFLLDNFTDSNLREICARIYDHLSAQGIWLYCDFEDTGLFWQKALLKMMYIFFRWCCGIEASSLPDAKACFSQERYRLIRQKTFYKGFIVSKIYEKC